MLNLSIPVFYSNNLFKKPSKIKPCTLVHMTRFWNNLQSQQILYTIKKKSLGTSKPKGLSMIEKID